MVFLANIDPVIQSEVLDQVAAPDFVACDTMNFWIDSKVDDLKKVLGRVDLMLLNDAEALSLSGDDNVSAAARTILGYGPKYVVVKRGEHGALLFSKDEVFFAPALPLEVVKDPTGAGDSFAGGFLGSLSRFGMPTMENLRASMIMGSVMASFAVEEFSLDGTRSLTESEIADRIDKVRDLVRFEVPESWSSALADRGPATVHNLAL